ncbi:SLATT domain-containing protein [Dermacoccus nishinomiyaensis]|uniref:SLATT domain-containing protein n=1 Tax=Dermacoccus nishinomiyaensis TaxID=1274 RepID=UPI0009398BDE|nr:SLATT domain-containing protein [Dermacoccus nishinomiyaensis]
MTPLEQEASRLEESAKFAAQSQFEAAKSWRSWNWVLGGLATGASGIGGVLTFANGDLQMFGGGLAIAAALSAAVLTTLRPGAHADAAQSVANEYLAIQGDARRLRLLGLPDMDPSASYESVKALAGQSKRINAQAAPPPRFAYRRARKNIENGGQTHEVDA